MSSRKGGYDARMKRALVLVAVALTACASPPVAPTTATCATAAPVSADGRAGIEAFNRAMTDAMRAMNDPALLGLWEDDGVSLLPGASPLVGKAALAAMLRDVESNNPGARMTSFDMQCSGIEVSGEVAHEYCDEHQVVDLGGGKPPFDGRGRILFVLHRAADGTWRLRREVFQSMKD
jgi:ketosteroid isomerase-like protein